MTDAMRILLIEDDSDAAGFLSRGLKEAGHVVDLARDGVEGADLAQASDYDVLLIDRMLPLRDGLSIVEERREAGDTTPILILSALGQVDDRVKGLRAGGDDYLAKPYAFSELLARVEALGRRQKPVQAETVYTVADLELDRLSHSAPGAAAPSRCSRANSGCWNI